MGKQVSRRNLDDDLQEPGTQANVAGQKAEREKRVRIAEAR